VSKNRLQILRREAAIVVTRTVEPLMMMMMMMMIKEVNCWMYIAIAVVRTAFFVSNIFMSAKNEY
jgi:ABC-type multidrug transport system permease subunit